MSALAVSGVHASQLCVPSPDICLVTAC